MLACGPAMEVATVLQAVTATSVSASKHALPWVTGAAEVGAPEAAATGAWEKVAATAAVAMVQREGAEMAATEGWGKAAVVVAAVKEGAAAATEGAGKAAAETADVAMAVVATADVAMAAAASARDCNPGLLCRRGHHCGVDRNGEVQARLENCNGRCATVPRRTAESTKDRPWQLLRGAARERYGHNRRPLAMAEGRRWSANGASTCQLPAASCQLTTACMPPAGAWAAALGRIPYASAATCRRPSIAAVY